MKKIGFVCLAGLDQFIDPIIKGLSGDYTVRKFIIRTQQDIYNAIDWTDIVWLEWCNQTAIMGTNYEGIKGKKVIIRLHRYEAFTNFPSQIVWEKVNCLILVAPHMITVLEGIIPDIKDKINCRIVYNGIDLDKIPLQKRVAGFDIACLGFINYRKNPGTALQILKKLVDIDKRYKLHMAGLSQDSCLQSYLNYMVDEMNLQDNIKFYGWVDDMKDFWKDKNYLLHTSIHESFGYAVFEGMARGAKPIVHNFRGAKELYPKKAIFNTIDEAVNKIISKEYNSSKYRDWIIKKGWTLENQLRQIKEILK
jgi:glycosyltransferase involved in cell wall biosynthesis